MTRRTLAVLLAAAALPLALAAAADPVPAWRARLEAFEKSGEAERRKLGLDRDEAREQLYARYPTPEVTFASPPVVCPGQSAPARLTGEVPRGALVYARGEAVEVVGGKVIPGGWEGTVRAAAGAAPRRVALVVVAPVSTAAVTPGYVEIGCRHTWTLDVGGEALVVRTELGGTPGKGAGEWRRGGKVAGVLTYRASAGEGSLDLDQDESPDEQLARAGGFQRAMASKEWKDLDARMDAEMKKVGACSKLPPEKMAPCFQAPQKELEKINAARQVLVAKAELEGAPAFGCRSLRLEVREGGQVEGRAEGCAGKRPQERVKVTGRYTSP